MAWPKGVPRKPKTEAVEAPKTSTSTSKDSSESQSGILPLPEPKKRGRPLGSKNLAKRAAEALPSKRALPEEPEAFEKAIRFTKMAAQTTIIPGLNSINRVMGVQEFSEEEKEGGATAFGALIWENWEKFDAKLLILMWLCGTVPPRAAEWAENRRKEKERKRGLVPVRNEQAQHTTVVVGGASAG